MARWFHGGETIEKVVAGSIDKGLPVMLGWDTEGYGWLKVN